MMDEPENGQELANEPEEHEPGTMGLLDHLEELRWAVLKSMSAVLAGVLLTACFFPTFFSVLRYPLDRAIANEPDGLVALTTTSVMGVFMVIIQVCMIGGVALGLPFVLYHFSRFVAPGLTQKEKTRPRPGLRGDARALPFGVPVSPTSWCCRPGWK